MIFSVTAKQKRIDATLKQTVSIVGRLKERQRRSRHSNVNYHPLSVPLRLNRPIFVGSVRAPWSFSRWVLILALFICPTTLFAAATSQELQDLGWTPAPVTSKNYCGGYYQDPMAPFLNQILPPIETTTLNVNSDQGFLRQTGTSILMGDVNLTQPGRSVHADTAYLNRNKEGQFTDATLVGNVVARQPGQVVVGDHGYIQLNTKVANFFHAVYRTLVSAFRSPTKNDSQSDVLNLNAWGNAGEVEQDQAGLIILHQATYTTCSPTTSTWKVTAKTITLNHDTGRGVARNAWLSLGNVPVLYTPYFNFPIDNRRQTGFLMPSLGNSSNGGLSLNLPFYWNIAPNYDALITPQYYSKRGLQMNGLFRFLTTMSTGTVAGSYLPGDKAFQSFQDRAPHQYLAGPQMNTLENNSDNRSYFALNDKTVFDPRWNSTINYNYVSDYYYYEDFGTPTTLTQNQLPQSIALNYLGDHWNFSSSLQGYQTLHPINLVSVANPYERLPELDLNGNYPNEAGGFTYTMNNQFVYFMRDLNPGEVPAAPNTQPIAAGRLNLQPSISLPLTWLPGYITPQLQLSLTHYNIGNQIPGFANEAQRSLPMFDIDSGLYFDRDTTVFGKGYEQTLEPRLFYLFVPYQNQSNLPLFDTALVPFSFDSLFLTNRFSGIDRIGDANQVSLGITTRLLDQDTGTEKFHASLGEIYYFENRRVSTCAAPGTPGAASLAVPCVDAATQLGATSTTEWSSPLAGQLDYYLTPNWSTIANAAWDPHVRQMVNSNLYLHYQPTDKPNQIFNITYNFIRFGNEITTVPPTSLTSHKNDLNQVGVSFAWPVKEHWNAVAGWNYNISRTFPQTYFYGLEYDSCCWAARVVAGRSYTSLNQNGGPMFNSAVYLQWQFKGLGTVGMQNPATLLTSNVSGYQDNFQSF